MDIQECRCSSAPTYLQAPPQVRNRGDGAGARRRVSSAICRPMPIPAHRRPPRSPTGSSESGTWSPRLGSPPTPALPDSVRRGTPPLANLFTETPPTSPPGSAAGNDNDSRSPSSCTRSRSPPSHRVKQWGQGHGHSSGAIEGGAVDEEAQRRSPQRPVHSPTQPHRPQRPWRSPGVVVSSTAPLPPSPRRSSPRRTAHSPTWKHGLGGNGRGRARGEGEGDQIEQQETEMEAERIEELIPGLRREMDMFLMLTSSI